MYVDKNKLFEYLNSANFANHGDPYERDYGHILSENFPNCEKFWKLFVVPLTKRIVGYPDTMHLDGDYRDPADDELQDIGSAHYSMFVNLIFAHFHLEQNNPYSMEDLFVHMGAACDLAETVLIKWYLLMKMCRSEPVTLLQGLSRQEFQKHAGELYDKKYEDFYSRYKENRKIERIPLINGSDLLLEYLGENSRERKNYEQVSGPIRSYRNIIVHDVRVARLIFDNGKTMIPRSEHITKYKNWRLVAEVKSNKAKIANDFREKREQCELNLMTLEAALNRLWENLIEDYLGELFSPDRTTLRDRFNISFETRGPLLLDPNDRNKGTPEGFISASGTSYVGGSAMYPINNDESN